MKQKLMEKKKKKVSKTPANPLKCNSGCQFGVYQSTRDLRDKPLHDMEGCFDEPDCNLHHNRHAQTTRAYERQDQPATPLIQELV